MTRPNALKSYNRGRYVLQYRYGDSWTTVKSSDDQAVLRSHGQTVPPTMKRLYDQDSGNILPG